MDEGATPVAHTGVLEEMKKYETGHFGGKPGRWEDTAKERDRTCRESKLKPPTLLFPDTLIFDDGKHRVELQAPRHRPHARRRLRVAAEGAHPLHRRRVRERRLQLRRRRRHGRVGQDARPRARAGRDHRRTGTRPAGRAALLEDQRNFFVELRRVVSEASKGHSPAQVQAAIPAMRSELLETASIARYVGDGFPAQVAKVYTELTGKTLPDRSAEAKAEEQHVAWHHGEAATPAQD